MNGKHMQKPLPVSVPLLPACDLCLLKMRMSGDFGYRSIAVTAGLTCRRKRFGPVPFALASVNDLDTMRGSSLLPTPEPFECCG